jgi:hypothetical protein
LPLNDIAEIGTGMASIGGAGTFDGVVLSGTLTVFVALTKSKPEESASRSIGGDYETIIRTLRKCKLRLLKKRG